VQEGLLEHNQSDPRESPDHQSQACISPPNKGNNVYCAVLGSDPMIKRFANQLVTDHQKTTDELKALIESGKVKVNPDRNKSIAPGQAR
jgi:hypothetical protein